MLGERRSRAAFSEGYPERVQENPVVTSVQEPTGGTFVSEEKTPISSESHSPSVCKPAVLDESCSLSVDYPAQKKDEIKQAVKKKTHVEAEPEEESDEAALHRKNGKSLRAQGLFFDAGSEKREFSAVLREVQGYLSKEHSSLVTADGSEEAKAQIRRFAGKYIQDNRIRVEGKTTDELIDAIYSEMAEFGFLTKYIFGEGIEEIDVNAWDDVEVQFSGGVTKKLTEHFDSPEHAINVVRRMLHVSGMVLDDASPSVLGHLSKNIRIAVLKTPIVDEDVGVAASIRIVNPQSMKKQDFGYPS